eukprot:6038793-Alexandrium_andersonii.AAC.1
MENCSANAASAAWRRRRAERSERGSEGPADGGPETGSGVGESNTICSCQGGEGGGRAEL